MAQSHLHQNLIDHACRTQGWTNAKAWRKAFLRKCQDNPEWASEMRGTEVREVLDECSFNPDAWKLTVENRDTLVLEFLEVDVSHAVTPAKHAIYTSLWWAFDSSSSFVLRVYMMDRFGIIRPYLTPENIHQVLWSETLAQGPA